MKIEITPKQAEVLETLWHRYYFDLFKPIRKSEEEEYQFRNAIQEIVEEINRQRKREKKNKVEIEDYEIPFK